MAFVINPPASKSIERVAFQDTDNNTSDFLILDHSTPQNSTYSEPEIIPDPEPEPEPEPEPTPEPEPEPTPEPEPEPEPLPIIYSDDIRINELFPHPSSGVEFVELYNFGSEEITLDGWKLKDRGGNSCNLTGKKIKEGDYLAVEKSEGCNIALNDKDGEKISLYDPIDEDPVFSVEYAVDAETDYFYAFDGKGWRWTKVETKGAENGFDGPEDIPADNDDPPEESAEADYDVYLNEILPNPKKGSEEYIEIFNNSEEDADLADWILRDSSKSGKYVFPKNSVIETDGLLAVYKKDFKFALNDGSDSVYLLDPNEKEISAVAYNKAKDGISYNWNGSKWRWSQYLTPGKENIFDDEPDFKIEKDKDIYKNFPANFEVKIKHYKKNKTKITWDFGDGHKSYKQKTTHKYEKKGKYSGSVKVSNGSEDVIKTLKIEVKDFPKYDIEIIEVNPNPDGKDSDLETITVKNNSKKRINLQNWSIATGGKKLTNHPISKKIILKPKEEEEITRKDSKFTLNNKKGKVELRYPNGKAASKMQYDKKTESIAEGEILEKTKLGWVWKNTLPVETPDVSRETSLLAVAPETGENLETPQILGESDERDFQDRMINAEIFIGGQSIAGPQKDFNIIFAELVYGPFLS